MDFNATLEKIKDHYETLFDELKVRFHGEEFKRKEEALFCEEYGCELMLSVLRWMEMSFEIDVGDIRPEVRTTDGKKAEIDFRIHILGNPTYFGVTHFKTTVLDTVCSKRPSEGWFAVSSRRFRLLNPCGHAIVGRITEFSVAEPKNKFLSFCV